MKICVIIPAYNEALTLTGIVTEIRKRQLDVLVIDDGSCDGSAAIAADSGANVIRNRKNLGKGACLIKGFHYALEHRYDAVVTMDGDGQHLPSEIDRFLEAAREQEEGIIIGNRMTQTRNMPLVRLLTNRCMSRIISRLSRQHIPDTQCGYRLIRACVLKEIALSTANYETESEIILKASRRGIRIASIPITTVYIDEQSKINPFLDTYRFLAFLIKGTWKRDR